MRISLPKVLSCLPYSVVYQLKSVMFLNYLFLLSSILALLVSSLSLAYSLMPVQKCALSYQFDEEPDPDSHQRENSDPDLDPHRSE